MNEKELINKLNNWSVRIKVIRSAMRDLKHWNTHDELDEIFNEINTFKWELENKKDE